MLLALACARRRHASPVADKRARVGEINSLGRLRKGQNNGKRGVDFDSRPTKEESLMQTIPQASERTQTVAT